MPQGTNAEPSDEAQAHPSKLITLTIRLHSCFYILDCFHEYYQPSVSVASCHLQFFNKPGVQGCSWEEDAEWNSLRIKSPSMDEQCKDLTITKGCLIFCAGPSFHDWKRNKTEIPLGWTHRGLVWICSLFCKVSPPCSPHTAPVDLAYLFADPTFSLPDTTSRSWTFCCDCTHLNCPGTRRRWWGNLNPSLKQHLTRINLVDQ